MKLWKVLKGLVKEYGINEVHILYDDGVMFTGSLEKWIDKTELTRFKIAVDNLDISKKIIYHEKAFLFLDINHNDVEELVEKYI